MITVDEYCKILKDAEDDLAERDRRIAYRKIELIGARASKSESTYPMMNCFNGNSSSAITDDEQKELDNDVTLARMIFEKSKLQKRIDFIRKYAEFPSIE
jgi:hypothetical protein